VIVFWIALAIGVFYYSSQSGPTEPTDETDEGTTDEGNGLFDTLASLVDNSGQDVEAFAHGKSLGIITVYPIGGGFYLRQDAAQSALRLKSAAETSGVVIQTDSAFRFMEQQQSLWAQFKAGKILTPVAPPGFSNHQSGFAWDIAVQRSTTSNTYMWLAANAADFGWTNVGKTFSPPEYWHWEYNPGYDNYA
jgi:hypothetical protein